MWSTSYKIKATRGASEAHFHQACKPCVRAILSQTYRHVWWWSARLFWKTVKCPGSHLAPPTPKNFPIFHYLKLPVQFQPRNTFPTLAFQLSQFCTGLNFNKSTISLSWICRFYFSINERCHAETCFEIFIIRHALSESIPHSTVFYCYEPLYAYRNLRLYVWDWTSKIIRLRLDMMSDLRRLISDINVWFYFCSFALGNLRYVLLCWVSFLSFPFLYIGLVNTIIIDFLSHTFPTSHFISSFSLKDTW